MAKPKKSKSRKSSGFPPAAEPPTKKKQSSPLGAEPKRPMRWGQIIMFLAIAIGGTYLAIYLRPAGEMAPRLDAKLIEKYPHDAKAFTQGLLMHKGFLWESTGREGESTVRKTNLKTGEVIKSVPLEDDKFGEGLVWLDGKFYQLTWKNRVIYVYDEELNLLETKKYPRHGWGLCTDGRHLITSDGTAIIRFINPDTLEEMRSVRVREKGRPVGQLNELEYHNGYIYANRLNSDLVYEIEPKNGDVTSVINLRGLWPDKDRPRDGLMNGIAINPETNRLLVTGKLCPFVYEVQLEPVEAK